MSVCKLAFLHLNELLHILDYSRFQNLSMKYRYKNVLWSPQEPCKSLNRFCSGVRCLHSMLFPKVVELECPERVSCHFWTGYVLTSFYQYSQYLAVLHYSFFHLTNIYWEDSCQGVGLERVIYKSFLVSGIWWALRVIDGKHFLSLLIILPLVWPKVCLSCLCTKPPGDAVT